MPPANTDLARKMKSGFTTTLSGMIDSSVATIPLSSAAGLPADTAVTLTIDRVNSSGIATPTLMERVVGVVSGSNITVALRGVEGTAQAHAAGAVVEMIWDADTWNDMVAAFLVEHNQDGTHDIPATTAAFDHVDSGGVWSGDSYGSTRAASMTSIVAYINGIRLSVNTVTARVFTASKDTYVDLGVDGVLDYNEVANNAASPALAADHIRVAIIVTGATNIANVGSINQGEPTKVLPIASSVAYSVTDSLGNLICNRTPYPRTIGYRQQIIAQQAGIGGVDVDITNCASMPVIVPAGRRVRLSSRTRWDGDTVGGRVIFSIKEGATTLQESTGEVSVAGDIENLCDFVLAAPSTGTHTYKLTARASAGGASIYSDATFPTIIMAELD